MGVAPNLQKDHCYYTLSYNLKSVTDIYIYIYIYMDVYTKKVSLHGPFYIIANIDSRGNE